MSDIHRFDIVTSLLAVIRSGYERLLFQEGVMSLPDIVAMNRTEKGWRRR